MRPVIKYSKRKSISISVDDHGQVIVRAPKRSRKADINGFLVKYQNWITRKQHKAAEKKKKLQGMAFDASKTTYYKEQALLGFTQMADMYAAKLNIKYKKLRLSNAKKRWGSCSSKGTVSINWRLYFAPEDVQKYVVLHELMHLRHMNHSKKFWSAVASEMPDYKSKVVWLAKNDYLLLLS